VVEPAVFAAKRLADQMHEHLASRGLTCVRVEVQATTDDEQVRSRLWRHDGLLSSRAVAERVRWQLDAWRTTGIMTGPLVGLRLVPDQVVSDTGRQLTLWGQPVVDERVARAADRIQTMLGHAAVTIPMLAGGRGPGERVVRVPWGDTVTPRLSGDRPWPGQIPTPAPTVVYPQPRPVKVVDAEGTRVVVSGRSQVSAPPAWLVHSDGSTLEVLGWAGPWPTREHWWDPAQARRCARFQVVTEDDEAWLLLVEHGRWFIEATYQ
jgi:protein ImuB